MTSIGTGTVIEVWYNAIWRRDSFGGFRGVSGAGNLAGEVLAGCWNWGEDGIPSRPTS